MSHPDDPEHVRLTKDGPGSADRSYGTYREQQFLDPDTGQTLNHGAPQQPQYGEQPYGVPAHAPPPYPAQPYPPYQAQPYQGYPAQGYPAKRGTNGRAIGALVAALVGILACGIGAAVGAILGHIALNQIKKSGEEGRGMALAGVIVVGWIFFSISLLYFALVIGFGIWGASHPNY
jgi:hypothetical protein